MSILLNKKILIVGLLSNKSIAYGVAESMHREGAKLAFTYQNERFEERIKNITQHYHPSAIIKCDVTNDKEIKNIFCTLEKKWDGIDGIIHSVAYAPADQLEGDFISNVNREGFMIANNISTYSFIALAKYGRYMMRNRKNASMTTITYLGSQRSTVNYNIMGISKAALEATIRYTALSLGTDNIRVNGVSAGPIRTLAASGIKNFRQMLDHNKKYSILKRNVNIIEVGNTISFLSSDLSTGITGEIIFVDAGYHCVNPIQ